MSTHSTIGIFWNDDNQRAGSVETIYCHSDGYPEGVGQQLLDHYSDLEKIKQLIDLGDLSSLGPAIGEKHNFNDYNLDWCRAYGRDRGETNVEPRHFGSLTGASQVAERYFYIYDVVKSKWIFSTNGGYTWADLSVEEIKLASQND